MKRFAGYDSSHSSDVITDLSLDWLKNRDRDKPFFLMHHFKAPHDLFSNAARYDAYLEDVHIPEPDNLSAARCAEAESRPLPFMHGESDAPARAG